MQHMRSYLAGWLVGETSAVWLSAGWDEERSMATGVLTVPKGDSERLALAAREGWEGALPGCPGYDQCGMASASTPCGCSDSFPSLLGDGCRPASRGLVLCCAKCAEPERWRWVESMDGTGSLGGPGEEPLGSTIGCRD
jgi:hypothetical protein